MKWLCVMAMIVNGQLSYSETHGFETRDECLKTLNRMIDLYRKDGIRIEDMNGWCYPSEDGAHE